MILVNKSQPNGNSWRPAVSPWIWPWKHVAQSCSVHGERKDAAAAKLRGRGAVVFKVMIWRWSYNKLGSGFKDFLFLPLPGEMIQFDKHIFQMGWFNHQPARFADLSLHFRKQSPHRWYQHDPNIDFQALTAWFRDPWSWYSVEIPQEKNRPEHTAHTHTHTKMTQPALHIQGFCVCLCGIWVASLLFFRMLPHLRVESETYTDRWNSGGMLFESQGFTLQQFRPGGFIHTVTVFSNLFTPNELAVPRDLTMSRLSFAWDAVFWGGRAVATISKVKTL